MLHCIHCKENNYFCNGKWWLKSLAYLLIIKIQIPWQIFLKLSKGKYRNYDIYFKTLERRCILSISINRWASKGSSFVVNTRDNHGHKSETTLTSCIVLCFVKTRHLFCFTLPKSIFKATLFKTILWKTISVGPAGSGYAVQVTR